MTKVALFTRAWIEIKHNSLKGRKEKVALFTRAWIEISKKECNIAIGAVALFTRAWIEISMSLEKATDLTGRPLHEGVD